MSQQSELTLTTPVHVVILVAESSDLSNGWGDGAPVLSCNTTVRVLDGRGERSRLWVRPLAEDLLGERPLVLGAGEERVQVDTSQTEDEDAPVGAASRLHLERLEA